MDLQNQVGHAVHVLNHDLQSSNRVQANQWLVHFQRTDAAWEVATNILASENLQSRDHGVELFAAQVLKRKIQSDSASLKAEDRTALQNALVMAARKFSTGPSQLLTQICLALSALVLRAVEWRNPVEQLFGNLSELQGQGNGGNAILELLTVLPEEVVEDQTVNASVDSTRRWQFTQEEMRTLRPGGQLNLTNEAKFSKLLSQTGPVLDFLLQNAKADPVESPQLYKKQRKVLRCLLSWVRVGCFLEDSQNAVPSHPLLSFVYRSLQEPTTFDLAVEVLTELVSRHEALPEALLPEMVSIKEVLLMPALAARNESVISGLVCFMAELGQATPASIAKGSSEALSLADALLRCAAFPSADFEIVESTLQFWCTFAEYLLATADDEGEQFRESVFPQFVPFFTALLEALLMRAQANSMNYVEDDIDGNTGLPDGLAHFRANLDEPLADICRFLGPRQFLNRLLQGADSWFVLKSAVPWQVPEAALFAMNMVADVIILEDQALDLSPVMHVLVSLQSLPLRGEPIPSPLIHKAGAQVVGSYSASIRCYPNAIAPLLSFLAAGLMVRVAASACATALRRLCEDVSVMANDKSTFEGLMQIGEGLHTVRLTLKEEEDVARAIAIVLSAVTGDTELNQVLERLLKSSHEAINTLLETDSEGSLKLHSASYAASLEACIRGLHRLGIYCSQLCLSNAESSRGEKVIVSVLAHFWPLIDRLMMSRHIEDSGLATAVSKTLSRAIQTSGRNCVDILPCIITSLSKNFIKFQSHVCFIKTAATAVEEFGHEPEHGPLFIETFRIFTLSDSMTAMNSSYACDQEPDLAEAYMNFSSMFVRWCPKGVVAAAEDLLEVSFNKATICCTAMHRGAAISALSAMSCLLGAGLSSLLDRGSVDTGVAALASVIVRICQQNGENVISGILYALLGVSAMARVHKATVILQQLAALCLLGGGNDTMPVNWSSLQSWLVTSVQALPQEYLKPGENESLIGAWLRALEAAAADCCNRQGVSDGGRAGEAGYMQGDGGRALKRVLREFADVHRYTSPTYAM